MNKSKGQGPKSKVKERPILFSGAMVKTILEGRKTQTRRIIKPQPEFEGVESFGESWKWRKGEDWFSGVTVTQLTGPAGLLYPTRCPFQPGVRLWVKETFSAYGAFGTDGRICYRADIDLGKEPHGLNWKPSIFMPRKASRITLEITGVRVERLQEISEEDARAEGVRAPGDWMDYDTRKKYDSIFKAHGTTHFQTGYRLLWESINGDGSWEKNPWVWAISFRRVEELRSSEFKSSEKEETKHEQD